MTATTDITEIIRAHKATAHLSARYVGGAPTYEWTGRATLELVADLKRIDEPYETFIADNRGHPDYGRSCVKFVVFGKTGEE